MSEGPDATAGRRRRPEFRAGRPTLTRERIARAALELLGDGGPAELTMRNVGARLDVSPRALYNYVADRRDLLAEIVAVCQADRPVPRLDPGDWRESLRAHCRLLRTWYRTHPGMLALAHVEDLTPFTSPDMLRADDAFVAFFLDIGLPPRAARRAWSITVLQVAGFAEVWDTWYDRPPPGADPAAWTGIPPNTPDTELPHLRLVAGESETPDELFETVMTTLLAGIEAMR
ncbi:TetR/AcrR family transcriptional regulator [Phytomonospora endophytica]|uniref:AcrR family transcriptional regulator n=1 Tax=Phytomonospora endophytica TaxID=714109 RepID=A0A841FZF2_9ACTN|nr:TetR/AcrR family transcriptional regulator [Phytomonospora endophytica]MBB6038747.1 AcrR family transcriptional regulator [Phytomonospora endophytica]GIG68457.1 TetR family transcriptional regulator [Phytomonospora endophytica]